MVIDGQSGRKLVTAAEAASLFGCTGSYIRHLAQQGELRRKIESARVVLYDLEDVKRVAKEKARVRRARGGRPRGRGAA